MRNDLLRGAKASILTFIALYLIGAFVSGYANPMEWAALSRSILVVFSIIALIGGTIISETNQEYEERYGQFKKKLPEGAYDAMKRYPPYRTAYIMAIAEVSRENEAKKEVKKPYVPPTREKEETPMHQTNYPDLKLAQERNNKADTDFGAEKEGWNKDEVIG